MLNLYVVIRAVPWSREAVDIVSHEIGQEVKKLISTLKSLTLQQRYSLYSRHWNRMLQMKMEIFETTISVLMTCLRLEMLFSTWTKVRLKLLLATLQSKLIWPTLSQAWSAITLMSICSFELANLGASRSQVASLTSLWYMTWSGVKLRIL